MSLITLKYEGRLDAVEIEHPVGVTIVVKHGDTIGLPARLAGRAPDGVFYFDGVEASHVFEGN